VSPACVVDLYGNDLESALGLFPEQIEQDYWVAYHRSSSIFEEQIDTDGLRWSPTVCSKSEVEEIAYAFETMGWAGVSGGGFVVLDPFTLSADFGSSEQKPIYLREHSLLPLTYTTRDFAGGESARAIRCAIADFEQYLNDSETRHQHARHRERNYGEFRDVDLDWLSGQIRSFRDLYEQCRDALEQHKYGVIYAVRFCREDLRLPSYSSSIGIHCFFDIGPERLVAKARLHADDDRIMNVNLRFNYYHEYMKRKKASDGLLFWFERGPSHG
jgi:hypothetical protein